MKFQAIPFACLLFLVTLTLPGVLPAFVLGYCNTGLHCDDEYYAIQINGNVSQTAASVIIPGFCGSFKSEISYGYMCIFRNCTDCTLFQAKGACVEAGLGKTFRSWCRKKA